MRVCDRCKGDYNVRYLYIPCFFEDANVEVKDANLREVDLCEECREKIYKLCEEFLNNDDYTV